MAVCASTRPGAFGVEGSAKSLHRTHCSPLPSDQTAYRFEPDLTLRQIDGSRPPCSGSTPRHPRGSGFGWSPTWTLPVSPLAL